MSLPDPKGTLALSHEFEHWSLTALRKKLIKVGATGPWHGHYITFRMAEVALVLPSKLG